MAKRKTSNGSRETSNGSRETLLRRLNAERVRGQQLLTVQEQSKSTVLSEWQLSILAAQPAHILKRLDLRIVVEPVATGFQARLLAGDQIGTIRLPKGKEFLDVLVEPKIGNAAFLRMLEYCFGSLPSQEAATAYESKTTAPAFVVAFVVRQVERFLARRRHRDYSIKFDPASRHPKGHIELRAFVTRQLPKAKLDELPCVYFDFSENVFENQVLASTLFIAGRLAASFAPEVRAEIAKTTAQARRHLPGVEAVRVSEADLDRFRYTKRNECFKPVHDLCKIVLFNSSVSLEPGRSLSFMSFSLNMADLFERYVRGLLQQAYGTTVVPPKGALRFPLHGTESSTIHLDGLLRRDVRCIVECKYKLVDDSSGIDLDEGRIKNADVFQCVAYATHTDVAADCALLCYPTAMEGRAAMSVAMTIRSFGRSKQTLIPIYVVLVNLAAMPARVLEALPPLVSQCCSASAGSG